MVGIGGGIRVVDSEGVYENREILRIVGTFRRRRRLICDGAFEGLQCLVLMEFLVPCSFVG